MKFLVVTRHFPPIPSGGSRRPYLMARALESLGHEVMVGSPAPTGEFPGVTCPHVQPEPPEDVDPRAKPLWTWSWRAWARELLRWPDPDSAWAMRLAREIIDQHPGYKPDWIIASAPPESVIKAAVFLKRRLKGRLLVDFRDPWLTPPRRPERQLWFRRFFEGLMGRWLLAQADLIYAVDDIVAADAAAIAGKGKQVHVVPQLIPDPFPPGVLEPAEDIHLVYTGQFSIADINRQISVLLDSFEQALAMNPRLRLHIAGHLTRDEREAIQKSPAVQRIQYHGALSLQACLAMQSAADALVLMSSEKGWAMPGKLFEYRAQNVPIIIFGSGPWREKAGLPRDNDPMQDMTELKKAVRNSLAKVANPGKEAFLHHLGLGAPGNESDYARPICAE